MSDLDEFGYSNDFKKCQLGDVAHIEMGQSPDSRFVFEDPYVGYPFLQGNAEFGVVSPSPKFGCIRPAKLAKKSDVLISVRAPVGAVNIADRDYCIGRGLAGVRIDGIEPNLAAQLVQHQSAKLRRVAQGTTFEAISKTDLQTLQLRLPPVAELPVIARVLGALDTAIHQTEAIAEKLKQVKQGLLHDLLTRGIDANGQLRPSHEVAPHLYKQSPLGWIPQEWSAHVFGDLVQHVIDFRGRTPKKLGMDWGGGDILALSANNVQPGGIDVSREAYFGSERLYRKWMTSGETRTGDVLLTMEAPLGNVAQIPDSRRYILSQRVISLRFMADLVLNDFAFWQMQSNEFQQAMVKRSTGSTATGIQRAELVKLHFKSPPVGEQALIAERLFSIERKLKNEAAALVKQRQEKCGLMNDLLTGRVRVTPLLAQ